MQEVNLIDSCYQTEVGSVFGAILVAFGFLFSSLRKWWKGLDPKVRALILVGFSTIIGTLDTSFDWIGKHLTPLIENHLLESDVSRRPQ